MNRQDSAHGSFRRLAATIMLQGTASDVGKSLLTAALCRILWQDGHRVAPFKSQNMSLNSYVTWDGKEIGRAQGMQADACRMPATTDMNPILLKPTRDMVSQVVVHGRPYRNLEARVYREQYLDVAAGIVQEALQRLRQTVDVVVLEGAGSPAEVNLKDRDIVNMRLAGWAEAPVLLVADIDRGGVFAAIVGTMEILTPEERARVRGFIINKFRGDVSLLRPGLDWLEQRTGKPVLGVIPYLPELGLEDEDSASLDAKGRGAARSAGPDDAVLDVAVIRLPRISNFTDFDPLIYEPDVRLRYITTADEWGDPDIVIVPGSKNTADDLRHLRSGGLASKLLAHLARGGFGAGICGGYQMLGERLLDPHGVESGQPETEGLGLIPAETVFAREKRTERVVGLTCPFGPANSEAKPADAAHKAEPDLFAISASSAVSASPKDASLPACAGLPRGIVGKSPGPVLPVTGYEIHMGETRWLRPIRPLCRVRPELAPDEPAAYREDGVITADGRLWGTYVHGILHNDAFRRAWLNDVRAAKGLPPLAAAFPFQERREAAFDRLADHVRRHLDMQRIYEMMEPIGGGNSR